MFTTYTGNILDNKSETLVMEIEDFRDPEVLD